MKLNSKNKDKSSVDSQNLNNKNENNKHMTVFTVICLFSLLGTIISGVLLSDALGIVLSLGCAGLFILFGFMIVKYFGKKNVFNFFTFAFSLIFSLLSGFLLCYWLKVIDFKNDNVKDYILMFSLSLSFLFIYSLLFSLIFKIIKDKEKNETFVQFVLSLAGLLFVVFIFLPCDTLFKNSEYYSFPVKDLILANSLYLTVPLFFVIAVSFLPKKMLELLSNLILGLLIGTVAQVVLMNSYIGQINGAIYDWKEHTAFTFINILLWIICISIPFIVSVAVKSVSKEIKIVLPSIIFLLASITLITDAIKAPSDAYGYKVYAFTNDKQYMVSSKKNIIVFVIDAVDNDFVKTIYNDDSKFFDDNFTDFTLYTNTCSVYDYTNYSHAQMMAGEYINEEGLNFVDNVYPRLKEAGYEMNFYNFSALNCRDILPYIDNYFGGGDSSKKMQTVDMKNKKNQEGMDVRYSLIRKYNVRLSMYQILPCILKKYADASNIDFTICIINDAFRYDFANDNDYYNEHLKLQADPGDDNYLVFQSIIGVHFPCDDYIGLTKYCLEVALNYCNQLKGLGLYDSSTIIIMSDHGMHDDVDGIPYPTAATPLFMIKEPYCHNEKMILSFAPVSHEELMPTILYNAGIYDEAKDSETIGLTIHAFKDGDLRTRRWYDSSFSMNETRKYTYTGDTAELERVVKEGIYEEVPDFLSSK